MIFNNFLTNFLVELAKRLTTRAPRFFRVIQAAAVILGATSAAVLWLTEQGYNLPIWLQKIGDMKIIINSVLAIVLAQLPNADPKEDVVKQEVPQEGCLEYIVENRNSSQELVSWIDCSGNPVSELLDQNIQIKICSKVLPSGNNLIVVSNGDC